MPQKQMMFRPRATEGSMLKIGEIMISSHSPASIMDSWSLKRVTINLIRQKTSPPFLIQQAFDVQVRKAQPDWHRVDKWCGAAIKPWGLFLLPQLWSNGAH
ncbi:hypothetical protein SRHO_G00077280 [Serrasalmus rhombeus]